MKETITDLLEQYASQEEKEEETVLDDELRAESYCCGELCHEVCACCRVCY